MEMGGHSQAPTALPSGKEPKLSLECEAEWPRKRSANVWNIEHSLPLPGFKTQILQSLAKSDQLLHFPASGIWYKRKQSESH